MIVVGIDPGFSKLGWAIIEVDTAAQPWTDHLLTAGVILTRKESRKRKIIENDDLVRRIRQLRAELIGLTCYPEVGRKRRRRSNGPVVGRDEMLPAIANCAYVATEEMSWGFQGTKAHRQLGMAWGVIVSVVEGHRKGLVGIAPRDLKAKLTGNNSASKEAVRDAILQRPGYDRFAEVLKTYPKGQHEHIGDAIGAAIASLETDVARFFGARV